MLSQILLILAFVAVIYFFALLGFKRPLGRGWNSKAPFVGAAVLTVIFILALFLFR